MVDPNKPKKPASSYLLFSMKERKSLKEERPGTNNSTLTALISLKWKVKRLKIQIIDCSNSLVFYGDDEMNVDFGSGTE